MSKAAAKKTTTNKNASIEPGKEGWFIALQLLDMSWRVAIPILVLSYIGIKLDRGMGSAPLFSLIGFFSSLVAAFVLVYNQIKSLDQQFFKERRKK